MTTAKTNNPLDPFLGTSWGARNVCSISGFGDHRSGLSGLGEETWTVLRDSKGTMTGFECPNEAMTSGIPHKAVEGIHHDGPANQHFSL